MFVHGGEKDGQPNIKNGVEHKSEVQTAKLFPRNDARQLHQGKVAFPPFPPPQKSATIEQLRLGAPNKCSVHACR